MCIKKRREKDRYETTSRNEFQSFNVQDRIMELFIEADISAYDLALICDVSRSTVSRWLNSNSQMTVQSIQTFCNALDVSLSDFFKESHTSKTETEEAKKLRLSWKHLSDDEKLQVLDFIDFIISKHKRGDFP